MSLKRSLAKQLLKMFFSGEDAERVIDALTAMRGRSSAPTKIDLLKALEAFPHFMALIGAGIIPLRLSGPDAPGLCVDYDGVLANDSDLLDGMRQEGEWRYIRKK